MTVMTRCAANILWKLWVDSSKRPDIAALMVPMGEGDLCLIPMTANHREGLRACCDADPDIWDIYPVNMGGAAFDSAFDTFLANPARHIFAVLLGGQVVGMTSYLNLALERQALEIGGTFMAPYVRGTGLNARVKRLMLARAFGEGIRRVQFLIDERNKRSQAAVLKLGATKEGVLRAERITWTGHVRDTGVFGLLREEWEQGMPARV